MRKREEGTNRAEPDASRRQAHPNCLDCPLSICILEMTQSERSGR